ncbi:hypothetical protein Cme02nite_75200 [Catellatospora methionotrophica]|uniref:Tetratricopeptide repeat protein n=1 Tax=Catellatospora methionotrophica TaxID=121620 RepID=A0A8J3PK51_9ACTN|nr:hypothetical protein [Catellatospora methionotrophica]GIG19188.1 hypothetical protein Cme02nite_75200 [Catellatospora methionotrophica]
MTTYDEVHDLIHRSWETPDGPARIAAVEQVLAQAEALGDPDLLYAAHAAATSGYHQSGEPMKAMMTFARCVADYDADPGRRSQHDEHLLLWQFKHMVSSMTLFPQLPLERTMAVLDDMQRRYQAGGHSMQAVYAYRHDVAAHLGDEQQADHWYRLWDSAPRDALSDCAGCDPSSKAYHLAWRGRDEDAIALAQDALSGRLTCSEQPHGILTTLLYPYLRTGRLDEARDAHRRAYRMLDDNKAELGRVATHVSFCGATGNAQRGLELIERHLPWLAQAPTPKTEMEFAASAAMVLRLLAEAGQGDLPVRRSTGEITVAALGRELRERAVALSLRFDERNGNSYQSTRIAELLDAKPLVAYLPLSVTAARAATVAPVPAVTEPPAELPDVPADLPLDGLLDLVDDLFHAEEQAKGRALTGRLLAEHSAGPLTDVQRGRLARLRAVALPDEELQATADAFAEAVDAFARAGDSAREHAARLQWQIAVLQLTGDGELVPAVYEAAEVAVAANTDPRQRRAALVRAAWVAAASGDLDRASSLLDRAEAEPGALPPARHASLLHLRAGVLQAQERLDEAAQRIRAAAALLRGTGHRDQLAHLLRALADLLGRLGDNSGAIAAFEEAAAVAQDPELRRSARANAGFMLVTTERAGEFIDDIVEHVCLMEAEGSPGAAAYTRHRLALALGTTGRFTEAAEVGEEALSWFLAQRDPEHADMVVELRDLLSRTYAQLGEAHVAIGQLDALLELVSGVERLAYRGDVLERAGELLWQVDRDGEAADRFGAAAAAYGQADLALATVHARRRQVMALFHAGRKDDAVALSGQLAELMAVTGVPVEQQAGFAWERAMAGYEAAQVLSNNDEPDHDAALTRIAPSAALFRSIGAFEEAALAELRHGQVLVVSGRNAEGQAQLRRAFDALPADHGARRDAAAWLARALDEQGETRQARELRAEHDLPEPE